MPHSTDLSLWYCLPFAGLLLSIALVPLGAPRFWEHHLGKVAAAWAAAFWLPFAVLHHGPLAFYHLLHIALLDYLPFLVIIFSLYTVAGGIVVEGRAAGTPTSNTLFLLVASLLASLIGTTGASMVMIRPLLRDNASRVRRVHQIVFFIFLVSNIGGALTPLGDPPLFLGFLHGVRFFWTLHNWQPVVFLTVSLLAIFFAIDTWLLRKETPFVHPPSGPIRVRGGVNILFLLGIVLAVIVSGLLGHDLRGLTLLYAPSVAGPAAAEPGLEHAVHLTWVNLARDAFILLMAWCSLRFTPLALREENRFTWSAVTEVAKLFAGIFVTIIPAILILKEGSAGSLGWLVDSIRTPAQYFWATGALSSFLDNAPTYLIFFNSAGGSDVVDQLMSEKSILMAVSCGAVFMGANSYIGNAPNFLVRNLAEEGGVKMPSFFGYMLWSGAILLPLFAIATWLFF